MFVFPFFSGLITKYSGIKIAQYISKKVSNKIIDNKVNDFINIFKSKLTLMYKNYYRNVIQILIINILILALSTLCFFLGNKNSIFITLISILTIYTMINSLIRNFKNIRKVKDNWNEIRPRVSLFLRYKKNNSITTCIHKLIENEFENFYSTLNMPQKIGHWIGAKTGFLPEKDIIKQNITETFTKLIINFVIKVILFRMLSIFVFYSIFIFILKPYIISASIHMNLFSIIFYPFTYSIPLLLHSLVVYKSSMKTINISLLFLLVGIASIVILVIIFFVFIFTSFIGLQKYSMSRNRNFFHHNFTPPLIIVSLLQKWFVFIISGASFIILSFIIK